MRIMPVIPLECPSCGTELRIDSDESAAICIRCGKPFVVNEAIVLNYIKLVTADTGKALAYKEFDIVLPGPMLILSLLLGLLI